MVERDDRLVILVAVHCALAPLVVEAIRRIELIHALSIHILLHFLPVFDCEAVAGVSLVVPLWCAEGGEGDLMVVVDSLRDVQEIVPSLELSALNVAIAPFAASEHGYCPAVVHKAGREIEANVVKSVVACAIPERAALLGVETLGCDADSSADRGSGYYGCAEARWVCMLEVTPARPEKFDQ